MLFAAEAILGLEAELGTRHIDALSGAANIGVDFLVNQVQKGETKDCNWTAICKRGKRLQGELGL